MEGNRGQNEVLNNLGRRAMIQATKATKDYIFRVIWITFSNGNPDNNGGMNYILVRKVCALEMVFSWVSF